MTHMSDPHPTNADELLELIGLRFSDVARGRPTNPLRSGGFMRFMQHRGPETQMAGSLAPFALAAEQFPLIPLLWEVVVWRARAGNSQATSTATFHVVSCRVCHTCQSGGLQS